MLDLILILDFSINPVAPKATDVSTVKAFATALLDHLDIREDGTRVGVVVYGSEASTVLHLIDSYDVETIRNSVSTAALAGKAQRGSSMSLAIVEAVSGFVNNSRPLGTTG